MAMTSPRAWRVPSPAAPKRSAARPEARALFLNPDGTPKPAGTRIVNEPLAQTLEAIAKGGPGGVLQGRYRQAQIVTRVQHRADQPVGDDACRPGGL